MFSFLKKNKNQKNTSPFTCDVHSHLIPAIDDGVKTNEEAVETFSILMDLGYKRAITTPHIYSDIYKNTPETISDGKNKLVDFLKVNHIDFEISFAAEYYFDAWFHNEVKSGNPLLTFGKKYLLFETNFISEPYQLKDLVFSLITSGYRPILAHPERYQYMTLEKAEDLRTRGVFLQINMLSLTGYYGKPVQLLAQKLIDKKCIDLFGSDCHNPLQARLLNDVFGSKYFKKAIELPLLNYGL